MEIGVLLVSLALVLLTSILISALGPGVFFSLLSISAVLGVVLFAPANGSRPLVKRWVGR
jgi:hypothetical protein